MVLPPAGVDMGGNGGYVGGADDGNELVVAVVPPLVTLGNCAETWAEGSMDSLVVALVVSEDDDAVVVMSHSSSVVESAAASREEEETEAAERSAAAAPVTLDSGHLLVETSGVDVLGMDACCPCRQSQSFYENPNSLQAEVSLWIFYPS